MHYSGYAYDAAASSDSGRCYILSRPRHAAAGPPTLFLLGAHAKAMSEIYKFSRGTQVMVMVVAKGNSQERRIPIYRTTNDSLYCLLQPQDDDEGARSSSFHASSHSGKPAEAI